MTDFRFLLPVVLFSLFAPVRAGEPEIFDFQNMETGDLPGDFQVTDPEARFSIVEDGTNKVLELNPSPLVESGVLLGESITGGATVRVRIKAEKKRRSSPRFGAGLHGLSGFRCLVVPAYGELQIVKDGEVLAKTPFDWKSGAWTVVEFSVLAAEGGSLLEGRAWEEGQARPETAQVTLRTESPPAVGKASLWATPFSGLPVEFDDVTVTPAAAAEPGK